eukprot:613064-Rhodomonas_salina.2
MPLPPYAPYAMSGADPTTRGPIPVRAPYAMSGCPISLLELPARCPVLTKAILLCNTQYWHRLSSPIAPYTRYAMSGADRTSPVLTHDPVLMCPVLAHRPVLAPVSGNATHSQLQTSTDLGYGATRVQVDSRRRGPVSCAIGLHACYAMSGTDILYAAASAWVTWFLGDRVAASYPPTRSLGHVRY